MANNDKENKIKKFTKEAIGKTLNQFNKEIGMADLVEINKNQDRILNGILSQVNDENTEKTEKSNIITLDNSTDGIVELKEIQGDTNVNVSKIEEMPITHDIGDKEGNVFTLNEIPKGAISIGEIQGNTMVNCNKDDKKELVYVKSNTKYYIQFNAVGSGEVVINLGGTELTTEIVEGYNCIPITTPSKSTNLMTIIGQGITISEVVVSEVVCGGYYKGLQSCFEEHMENGKYRVLLRGIALDGSKVNGIKLYINEPLRGIGDTKDRLCIKNGKLMVEKKCGSITLDGSNDENWGIQNNTNYLLTLAGTKRIYLKESGVGISDKLIVKKSSSTEGVYIYPILQGTVDYIRVANGVNKWSDKTSFIQWLQQNPVTLVYPLEIPTYEEVTNEYGLPIVFEGYENGIVYIDSAVTPTTHIKYTSNNQLATTLSEAEEQNITTQEDINMNVITYMMDIDMMLTDMEMSNDTSVMAVRRDSSNENMLDRMSEEDKKVYRDNTVVMLEKMITANVLEKEDIEGRVQMYYDKGRISKEQYEYLKSLL